MAERWWRFNPSNSVTANPKSGISLSGPSGDVMIPPSALIELPNEQQMTAISVFGSNTEQVSNTRRQKNKKSVNTALFKRNLHVSGIKPIYISFWACIIDRFRCMESCERSWVRIWQSQKFRIWNVMPCRYRNDSALLTISRRNYREII